jgi:hypothetical protein
MKKFIIFFLLIITSCEREAEIATYFSVNHFSFYDLEGKINESAENTAISDGWVTINGNFLGAFEIPSKIPIINIEDNNEIRISPGIKENGISGSRIIYPFYNIFEVSIDKSLEEETIFISPETRYKENTNFKFLNQGSFEIGNMLQETENSDTIPLIQSNEVFDGEKSCAICINNSNNIYQVITIDELLFNSFPDQIFLELNFKSDIDFKIGLIRNNNVEDKIEHMKIYKSENWKKIYLNLSSLIIPNISNSTLQIYFESEMAYNDSEGCTYLDNLKVVY